MRICHFVSTFPPYQGGMGNTCYYQAQKLIDLGYEITVFTPDYKKGRLKTENQKLKVVYLKPLLKYGNTAFVPQIVKYLKKFEIVHLHWPFIGGAEMVLFWFWLQKILCRFNLFQKNLRKSILIVQYQMDLVGRGILRLIFDIYQLLFLPLMVKIANKIIVSSFDYIQNSRLKKYLQKYPDKFVEIPLGVDTHKFYPQEKDLTLIKKYNLGSEDRIILFVGGLDKAHYFKGVDKLLQAVAVLRLKIPDLRLLIIGEGDLRSSYEKLAQDLGIGANVIFAGRVSDEDLSEHYNLADFVVLPSIDKSESLGLVLLEAMACAKPIIVSNLPGPRTLVQKNINGLLVEPGKIKDLAEKIKFLLENKELIKKWGINGRHLVEERYNLFLIIQALDKLYKKL